MIIYEARSFYYGMKNYMFAFYGQDGQSGIASLFASGY